MISGLHPPCPTENSWRETASYACKSSIPCGTGAGGDGGGGVLGLLRLGAGGVGGDAVSSYRLYFGCVVLIVISMCLCVCVCVCDAQHIQIMLKLRGSTF